MSSLAELALWITAVAGGLGALGYLGNKALKACVRAWHWVTETRRVLRSIWVLVSYELNLNGGGSIKDNIHDIAVAQGKTQRDVVQLRGDVQALTVALRKAADKYAPNERDLA